MRFTTSGRQQDCRPGKEEKRVSLSCSTVILCVDDEPTILKLRQVLLSIAGYKVLTATCGESAMRLFTLNHVDLVITDQLLPGRSGTELTSEMKQLKPEVPIILYTGLEELPPSAAHADVILVKGITPPEFLAAIAKLVAKPQASRAEAP
jgi:CheY-like chemotaxis protein